MDWFFAVSFERLHFFLLEAECHHLRRTLEWISFWASFIPLQGKHQFLAQTSTAEKKNQIQETVKLFA